MAISFLVKISVDFVYDPFGMITFGREWQTGIDYRYGFNGYENTDELYGNRIAIDFGERIYDGRIGRFLSVDEYASIYNHQSPFAYFSNRPVSTKDFNGKGGPGIAGGVENTAHRFSNNNYSHTSENIESVNESIKQIANVISANALSPLTFNLASGQISRDYSKPYGYLERGFMISKNLNSGEINTSDIKEGYADAGGAMELPDSYSSHTENPIGIFHYHFLSDYQYQDAVNYECSSDCISDRSGLAPSANDILNIVPGYGYYDTDSETFNKTAENGQFSAVYAEGKIYVLLITDSYLYNKYSENNKGSLASKMVEIMNYSSGSLEERREAAVKTVTTYSLQSGVILLETDLSIINLQLVK